MLDTLHSVHGIDKEDENEKDGKLERQAQRLDQLDAANKVEELDADIGRKRQDQKAKACHLHDHQNENLNQSVEVVDNHVS